jgi:hypothetical protein
MIWSELFFSRKIRNYVDDMVKVSLLLPFIICINSFASYTLFFLSIPRSKQIKSFINELLSNPFVSLSDLKIKPICSHSVTVIHSKFILFTHGFIIFKLFYIHYIMSSIYSASTKHLVCSCMWNVRRSQI